MRMLIQTTAFAVLMAAVSSAWGQAPKDKGSEDQPPPAADRPRNDATPRPRREPRPDDEQPPPPPGKASTRGRADGPRITPPASTPFPAPPAGASFPGTPGMPAQPSGFMPGPGGYRSGPAPAFPGRPGMNPGIPGAGMWETPPDDPEMRELMKQDAELDHQTNQMAHQLRQASGDERTRIREALADTVAKHFEVRQKRRELQIKRMEEELKRLREEIAKRNDARKSIIDNRVREIVGEPRDLDF